MPVATQNLTSKRNVVVIGGSYTALNFIDTIAPLVHKTHQVVLIDESTHFKHLFAFPRFSVVPGHAHRAFVPRTNAFHASPANVVSVICAKALEIHANPNRVVLEDGDSIEFDYLVLATGCKLPPPGGVEAREKSEGVKFLENHAQRVKKAKEIVIVGGGAVGIQLASDIMDYYADHEERKKVTLVHSRAHLMPIFQEKVHEIIMARLIELGVTVILEQRLQFPEGGHPEDGSTFEVVLQDGRKLSADLLIPCMGGKPLSFPLRTLSPESINSQGFVNMKRTHQITDERYPNVFAIGDVANSGAHKAARPGGVQARIAANNVSKLIRASLGEEVEPLEEYFPGPASINMSLGLKRKTVFRNTAVPGEEATYDINDNGGMDVRSSAIWEKRAPGVPEERWSVL